MWAGISYETRRGFHIPNTRSAKRQLRKSLVNRAHNQMRRSAVRYWRGQVTRRLAGGDREGAAQALPSYYAALDKAAKRGVIHPNRAARMKARMTKRLERA